jgi:hypothetical protein
VDVPLGKRGKPDHDSATAAARSLIRDAVAVLSFFRSSSTTWDTSRERFALVVDVASALEWRWMSNSRGHYVGSGVQLHGAIGDWTFSARSIRRLRADSRFRYLSTALADTSAEPGDFPARLVSAVRTWNLADPLDLPSVRITMAATALEAVFGNPYRWRQGATGGHRLAQRAAYVWCATDVQPANPHGPGGRPLCPFIGEGGIKSLDHTLQRLRSNSGKWYCSWYADALEVYEARNAALHGGPPGDERLAKRCELRVEGILGAAIDWAARQPPGASLQVLLAEIAAQPRGYESPG